MNRREFLLPTFTGIVGAAIGGVVGRDKQQACEPPKPVDPGQQPRYNGARRRAQAMAAASLAVPVGAMTAATCAPCVMKTRAFLPIVPSAILALLFRASCFEHYQRERQKNPDGDPVKELNVSALAYGLTIPITPVGAVELQTWIDNPYKTSGGCRTANDIARSA